MHEKAIKYPINYKWYIKNIGFDKKFKLIIFKIRMNHLIQYNDIDITYPIIIYLFNFFMRFYSIFINFFLI